MQFGRCRDYFIEEFCQIVRWRVFKLYGCTDEIENFVRKPANQLGLIVEVKIKLHGVDFTGDDEAKHQVYHFGKQLTCDCRNLDKHV